MDASLHPVMRGLSTRWESTSTKSGIVTILHDDLMKPVSTVAWAASLRYVFDLSSTSGKVEPRTTLTETRELFFDVSWQ